LQQEIFLLGTLTSGGPTGQHAAATGRIGSEWCRRLEQWIDEATESSPSIDHFILPGGTELASRLHVARATCRRVERTAIAPARSGSIPVELLAYLNRLSDLLFAWARQANAEAGCADEAWRSAHVE
jgi:cob(I)alamin adenosyltransferase